MIGEDFLFGKKWLSDFEMKMYDPDNSQQFISRDIDKSDFTALRHIPNHYSVHYSDVLTLSFLIIKNDELCSSQNEMVMSSEEINDIRAWLESPKIPTIFTLPSSDNININYFGIFTDIQPFIVNQECFGLYLTFSCNAPYGFSDEYKLLYKINGSSSEIQGRYSNMSCEHNDYLKPIITIHSSAVFGSTESVIIKNKSDNDKSMSLKLPSGVSKIIIDCQKKKIIDENGNLITMSDMGMVLPDMDDYGYISAETFSIYWLRLVPKENKLSFIASANNTISNIEISTRYIIKSGGF